MITVNTDAFFDCRVWQVPTLEEAANILLWRELDAARNSVFMVARAHFSHNQVQNKNTDELQEMLFIEKGINWNDFSNECKRGTYFKRAEMLTKFSAEEIDKLPEKHEARVNPDLEIRRSVVVQWDLPRLTTIQNKAEVLFLDGEARS